MKLLRLLKVAALVLGALTVLASGGGGGSSSSDGSTSEAPPADVVSAVRDASAAAQAIYLLGALTDTAAAETGGSVITSSDLSADVFSRQGVGDRTLEFVIDLDLATPAGEDLFPFATGRVGVTATYEVDAADRTIGYDPVSAECLTEVSITDAVSGITAVLAQGTVLAYTAELAFTRESLTDWGLSLVTTGDQENVAVAIRHPGVNRDIEGTMNGAWEGVLIREFAGGQSVVEHSLTGTRRIGFNNLAGDAMLVIWTITGPGQGTVTVANQTSGSAYGPYDVAELRTAFGTEAPDYYAALETLADYYQADAAVVRQAAAAALGDDVMNAAVEYALSFAYQWWATSADVRLTRDIDRTVDLDAIGPGGEDLFPNGTGQIRVTGTGDLSLAGRRIAFDDARAEFLTDVTLTDPVSGLSSTWPLGELIEYSASMTWSFNGLDDFGYELAGSHSLAGGQVVIDDGQGNTLTGEVTGDMQSAQTFVLDGGNATVSRELTGTRTVTWTAGEQTHEVTWALDGPDGIMLTVDDRSMGPFSAAWLEEYFQAASPAVVAAVSGASD